MGYKIRVHILKLGILSLLAVSCIQIDSFFLSDDKYSDVLRYFRHSGDSEMYSAAKFLTRNIPYHSSLYGDIQGYYDAASLLLQHNLSPQQLFDTLEYTAGTFCGAIRLVDDKSIISSDFLINNIERAFKTWRTCPWCRHVSFNDFCEYILPYKVADNIPLVDDWQNKCYDFAYGNLDHLTECLDCMNDPCEALSHVNNILKRMTNGQTWTSISHGYPLLDPELFVKMPSASCDEYCQMGAMILRSKGIPVTIDFTPLWSNRSAGHSWSRCYHQGARISCLLLLKIIHTNQC